MLQSLPRKKSDLGSIIVTFFLKLQSLLQERGVCHPQAATLGCDNIDANYLSTNPMVHTRTKSIVVDYHFVKERAENKLLNIHSIPKAIKLQMGLQSP